MVNYIDWDGVLYEFYKHILQLSIDLTKSLDKHWSLYNITASNKTSGYIQVIKKLENDLKIKKKWINYLCKKFKYFNNFQQ